MCHLRTRPPARRLLYVLLYAEVQVRQRLRATDSEVEASPDGSRVQYEELPPDFGMRVPSGDTDDEPDMEPGNALTLPTVLLFRF